MTCDKCNKARNIYKHESCKSCDSQAKETSVPTYSTDQPFIIIDQPFVKIDDPTDQSCLSSLTLGGNEDIIVMRSNIIPFDFTAGKTEESLQVLPSAEYKITKIESYVTDAAGKRIMCPPAMFSAIEVVSSFRWRVFVNRQNDICDPLLIYMVFNVTLCKRQLTPSII